MTTRDLLGTLGRRWYVVAGVLALTAVAVVLVGSARTVYWTRADLVFLPPDRADGQGNALEGSDQSLIFFAAAVERQVNGDDQPLQLASTEATLYGTGVSHGSSVVLPNAGGQWQTNFNEPVLTIQVVDATPEATKARFDATLARVQEVVDERQQQAGVPAAALVRTRLSPDQPQIAFVSGSTKRALAGTVALGAGLAVAAALGLDRLGSTLRRRRGRSLI